MTELPESHSATSPPRLATTPLVETIGKWSALLASVIAAGQAGTTWLHGYWQSKSEEQKAAQELKLADIKEKSDLAQQYLKLILDKDTKAADQVQLLSALAEIDGHPLQNWAREQYQLHQKILDNLFAAYKAQDDAAQLRDTTDSKLAVDAAELERLNSEIELAREDAEKRQQLQIQRQTISAEIGRLKGALSVALVTIDDTKTAIARGEQGALTSRPVELSDKITAISGKVTAALLESVFPEKAHANIETAAPYLQAAFQEFKVSDKKLAAAIIATVAVETPLFEAYEEPAAAGQNYENRLGLGNKQLGDGVRFRGRGYLGITGRANYEAMSTRLGLGDRLVNSPEDAKSPEVASRVLVAWFVDRQDRIMPALAADNLRAIRGVVNGNPENQIEKFTKIYNTILTKL